MTVLLSSYHKTCSVLLVSLSTILTDCLRKMILFGYFMKIAIFWVVSRIVLLRSFGLFSTTRLFITLSYCYQSSPFSAFLFALVNIKNLNLNKSYVVNVYII